MHNMISRRGTLFGLTTIALFGCSESSNPERPKVPVLDVIRIKSVSVNMSQFFFEKGGRSSEVSEAQVKASLERSFKKFVVGVGDGDRAVDLSINARSVYLSGGGFWDKGKTSFVSADVFGSKDGTIILSGRTMGGYQEAIPMWSEQIPPNSDLITELKLTTDGFANKIVESLKEVTTRI
ncbi:MAG: hypothetical protein ABJC87_21830 [Roseobacter sp.]